MRKYFDFGNAFPLDTAYFAAVFQMKAEAVSKKQPQVNLNKHYVESSIELKMFLLPPKNH